VFFWEVTELVRKLFLTGIIVFCGRGSVVQIVFGLMVSIFAHLLHTYVKPFKVESDQMLQHAALMMVWLTLMAGLILKADGLSPQNGNVMAAVVLIMNYSVLLLAIVFLVLSGSRILRRDSFQERQNALESRKGSDGSFNVNLDDPELIRRMQLENMSSSSTHLRSSLALAADETGAPNATVNGNGHSTPPNENEQEREPVDAETGADRNGDNADTESPRTQKVWFHLFCVLGMY